MIIFPPGEGPTKKTGGKEEAMAIAMEEAKGITAGDRRKRTGTKEAGAMAEAKVEKVGTKEAGEVAGVATGEL